MKYFPTNAYARKNTVYLRGYANGKRFLDEYDYKPYLFLPGEGPYKTIDGKSCFKRTFDSIYDARQFVKQMDGIEGSNFYGMTQWIYPALNDEFPGMIDYDQELINVIAIDIEVHSPHGFPEPDKAEHPITAITLMRKDGPTSFKSITLGLKPATLIDPESCKYFMCKDEKDLLKKFLVLWNDLDAPWSPDVVTGWNIELFDIPYLVNRTRRLLGVKWSSLFSPYKIVTEREIVRGKYAGNNFDDRKEIVYDLAGIATLDYLQLYRKFTFAQHESYALQHIAMVELGEGKVDYSEYRSLPELYEKNHDKYIDYNIKDDRLVLRLDNKMGFLNLVFALAYKAKVNYTDALTTIRPWDVIIHNHLLAKNIVIPQSKDNHFRPFEGAMVKGVQVGLHRWVVSFDLTSLYPSIMSQCNVSPETFVEKVAMESVFDIVQNQTFSDELLERVKRDDLCITANGCLYRKDRQGFIGELLDRFIKDRGTIKDEMQGLEKENNPKHANKIIQLHNYQWALKILSNGLYGALGSKYFRWFNVDIAESIPMTGQLGLSWIVDALNDHLNKEFGTKLLDYVLAGDTDSVYLNLASLVKQAGMESHETIDVINFLDKFCKENLEPFIKRRFMALGELLNSYNQKFVMKREAICNKAIWRGKKMYILNVWNNEGVAYATPKLKMKGIEAVRSSTPMVCRGSIKKSIDIIMNKDEKDLHEYVAKFENDFWKLPFEEIGRPSTCNGIDVYADPNTIWKTKCPMHVKGALVYNKILGEHGLTNKYHIIHNKDKIKHVYLKKDNPFGCNVLAVYDELPEEFGAEEYLDREKQFEKTFLFPIRSITNVIGWRTNSSSSLFD